MGAVQKLATVVIIGLVALATVLVVYLADEPNRRSSETSEQEIISIERGASLYITYCLQCHGPAGLGRDAGEDPGRIGAPLNQAHLVGNPEFEDNPNFVFFQSDDPVEQGVAESYLRYMITYGIPQDPRRESTVMPAFGTDLNVEQINDLVFMIMNGDWDYVYNQAVLYTGHNQAQADCDWTPAPGATPTADELERKEEGCENAENEEFALYPTVPPPADQEEVDDASDAAEDETQGGILIEGLDSLDWSIDEVTVRPGDTIQVVNGGVLQHDFVVDELGIAVDLTSEISTVTIPEDAEPGSYEFYCSIPGHADGGMVGTLTIEAP